MIPHVKNVILASADQVAIDAVAARLMGFDPLSIKYIRLAHERGLSCGVVDDIEVAGEDISETDFQFHGRQETFASRGQKAIYHGPLKPFEKLLLQSPLVPWSYFASHLYHNVYWYPFVGRKRVEAAMNTKGGGLFKEYGDGQVVMPGVPPRTTAIAAGGLAAMLGAVYWLTRAVTKKH